MMVGVKKKKKKCSRGKGEVDAEDRISDLPDSLIHHIMSFLKMQDVRRTCILSRRWQFLWTSVPVLDFGKWESDDLTFIDLSLMLYEGRKILRFSVYLCDVFDGRHVDSWIRFAARRDVEELELYLYDEFQPDEKHYRLPRSLLDCGALRVLKLGFCVLKFTAASFCFPSLMELHLYYVEVTDLDTSGCPLLQNLMLEECKFIENIYAPTQKLKYLNILECSMEKNSGLTLYAPYLQFFEYFGHFWRDYYKFMDLLSIRSASLTVQYVEGYDSDSRILVELLKQLGHATTLKLSEKCIELLSYRERNNLKTSPLSATSLETNWEGSELPGIALLLRSFPCLETLIINIGKHQSSPWDPDPL